MRKIQILGAFIAVLAFSALTVASASATLWLKNGTSLSSETPVDFEETLILHHTGGLAGSILIDCSLVLHGTVGPGALDLVTDVLPLPTGVGKLNEVSCEFLVIGNCGNAVGELILLKAINLPWHTLLELVSGKTIDKFLPASGKEPGYEFPCPKLLGFKGKCEGENTSEFTKNGTNGAIFEYPGTIKVPCSDGGEWTVLGLGEVLGFQVS